MKKNNKQEKNAAALAGTMAVGGVGTYALGKSVEKDFKKLVKKTEDAKAIADKLNRTKSMKRWGKGLMIGIQIDSSLNPFDIKLKCLENGLCVTTAGSDVIRFLPPLTISYDEIDCGLKIFKTVL